MTGKRPVSLSLSLIVESVLVGAALTSIAATAAGQPAQPTPTVEEAVADLFANDPALQTPPGVWMPDFVGPPSAPTPDVVFAAHPDLKLEQSEIPMGDLDGDGIDDFYLAAVGSPEENAQTQGRLVAYSGWTGATLFEYTNAEFGDGFSMAITAMPDVSGDGGDDLLVGAPFSSAAAAESGAVYILNGADGKMLYTITSPVADATLGLTVASAGDVNKDGLGDVLIAAPFDGAGKAYLYLSGSGLPTPGTGVAPDVFYPRALTTADADFVFEGEVAVQSYGLSLAGVGDVNGDGAGDVAVGAPHYDDPAAGETDNRGRVYVYSGADGSVLGTISGHRSLQSVGFAVTAAGDVNLDGRADVLVGAPGEADATGAVYLFLSPADSAAPWARTTAAPDWRLIEPASAGPLPDQMFGMVTALGRDTDGDGVRDWVVQSLAPFEANPDQARIRMTVYSGATGAYLDDRFVEEITPPDPPLPPGGDPADDGDPDQVGVVLSNFGMEGATLQQGDLNLDTRVGAPDLIIAIENTFGAAAATQSPDPDAGVDCTGVIPLVDETGAPVDPCEGDSGGTPGSPGNPIPLPDNSFFSDFEAFCLSPDFIFVDPYECALVALCIAGHEPGGLLDQMGSINGAKAAAQAAYDDAMGGVKSALQNSVNAAQAARAGKISQLQKTVSQRQKIRGGVLIVGGTAGVVVGVFALAEAGGAAAGGAVVGAAKTVGNKGFSWKTIAGTFETLAGGVLTGFGLADWLNGTVNVNETISIANNDFVAATATATSLFNAQNAIHLPALQAACDLAAQRRMAALDSFQDRVTQLKDQCLTEHFGVVP